MAKQLSVRQAAIISVILIVTSTSIWVRQTPSPPTSDQMLVALTALFVGAVWGLYVWPIVKRDDNRGHLAASSHGIGPIDRKKLTVKQAVVIQVILVTVSTIIWWSLRP